MERIVLYSVEHIEGGKNNACVAKVIKKEWQVVKKYAEFVLCVDEHGIKECFTYWYIKKYSKPPVRKTAPNGKLSWIFE